MIEENRFFTISQVAKICSTSRSTLLRMEKDGILSPAYVNDENGYRFYVKQGIMRVMRNLAFQDVGVTHKELYSYYSAKENDEILLSILMEKLNKLHAMVDTLYAGTKEIDIPEIDFFHLPDTYCYSRTLYGQSQFDKVRPFLWEVIGEAMESGYSFEKSMHPFISVNATSFLINGVREESYDFIVNIPIIADKKAVSDEKVIHYEEVNTITSYFSGGTKAIGNIFGKLGEEIRKRNLFVTGDTRIITIVKSLPEQSIPEELWVTRICVPVKSN